MPRTKANQNRKPIICSTEAYDAVFSSSEAESIIGLNRGVLNRVVSNRVIVPVLCGKGAGVHRQFSLWNLIQFQTAYELLPFFKTEIILSLLRDIYVHFQYDIINYAGYSELYDYLFCVYKNQPDGPFEAREPEIWQTHKAIFGIKMLGKDKCVQYPFIEMVDPQLIQDHDDWFGRSIIHFINMHTISCRAITKIIEYDSLRDD